MKLIPNESGYQLSFCSEKKYIVYSENDHSGAGKKKQIYCC